MILLLYGLALSSRREADRIRKRHGSKKRKKHRQTYTVKDGEECLPSDVGPALTQGGGTQLEKSAGQLIHLLAPRETTGCAKSAQHNWRFQDCRASGAPDGIQLVTIVYKCEHCSQERDALIDGTHIDEFFS